MKRIVSNLVALIVFFMFFSGCQNVNTKEMGESDHKRVVFLHHSTGNTIWRGGNNFFSKVKSKLGWRSPVEAWFQDYNRKNGRSYVVESLNFPKKVPYGWKNYPFDYYNIWVKHGDLDYYMEEPTLKSLTAEYDMIIFKHCFPGSKIVFDGVPDIDSERKMIENYKMQYEALKQEMYKYPETLFLVWTPPALTRGATNPESARAASEFSAWMMKEWDQRGDNIFIWDFRTLETGGGDYLLPENAVSESDSHPSNKLASQAYPWFCKRISDVLEGHGDQGSLTGID